MLHRPEPTKVRTELMTIRTAAVEITSQPGSLLLLLLSPTERYMWCSDLTTLLTLSQDQDDL